MEGERQKWDAWKWCPEDFQPFGLPKERYQLRLIEGVPVEKQVQVWDMKKPEKPRQVAIWHNSGGYCVADLEGADGKVRPTRIARLVCWTYHEPQPPNKRTVEHGDLNKDNNHPDSIAWADWATQRASQPRRERLKGEALTKYLDTVAHELIVKGTPQQSVAKMVGRSTRAIEEIARGTKHNPKFKEAVVRLVARYPQFDHLAEEIKKGGVFRLSREHGPKPFLTAARKAAQRTDRVIPAYPEKDGEAIA